MRILFLAFITMAVMSLPASSPRQDAEATVVVYNAKDPESKALADFYCTSRGIDPSMEIPLSAPASEEISREEYDLTIANPLRRIFQERGYWSITQDMMNHPIVIASKIRYLVLIRGIPLKIKECGEYPGSPPPPFPILRRHHLFCTSPASTRPRQMP